MIISIEVIISLTAALAGLLLLIFAVNWTYFRDWIAIFLYKCVLDSLLGTYVVIANHIEYPYRQLPHIFKMSLLFEYWIFPILCILFNQITRERGIWSIILYAAAFSAGITLVEYPLERYTQLIRYIDWSSSTTFFALFMTFLSSRAFIAFYRWGCNYFPRHN
ncbi:MAG: hypothetical protein PHO01_06995 [Desulfotomaculaceae bacterium]|nr:hypothetical protein [Desulfotomaculaceae bacterium]